MNLPNWLTLSRVFMIPICVGLYFLPVWWGATLAALVFSIAAITDWFDGYLARKMNLTTPLGAFLDPVADKLIVAAALVALVHTFDSLLMTIPAIIIVGREIVISALREWMAELGKRASVAVSLIGKVKTTFQMVAIILLLAVPHTGTERLFFDPQYLVYLDAAGLIVLNLAAILTLWSMVMYVRAAWYVLMPKK